MPPLKDPKRVRKQTAKGRAVTPGGKQPAASEAAAADAAASILGSRLNSGRAKAAAAESPTEEEQAELQQMEEEEEAEQEEAAATEPEDKEGDKSSNDDDDDSDDDDSDDEELPNLARLEELAEKDPLVGDRKSPLWMSVEEMKEERRLRGDKSKAASIEGHSNRKTQTNGLIKRRAADQAKEDRRYTRDEVDPRQWECEEDEIVRDAGVLDDTGKPKRWTKHDFARLVLVKVHPDSAAALGLQAKGFVNKEQKRNEFDGNSEDRNPWTLYK